MDTCSTSIPFSLPRRGILRRRPFAPLFAGLESLIGLAALRRVVDDTPANCSSAEYPAAALRTIGIEWCAESEGDLSAHLEGPLIIALNHPFGIVDGLVALAAVAPWRPDLRVLANPILSAIPGMRELIFAIDPSGRETDRHVNIAGLKQSIRHLKEGGALVVFPAGRVGRFSPRTRRVEEGAWSPLLERLSRQADAPVIPGFIPGRNSLAFQMLSLIHERLGTLRLPREVANKRGSRIKVLFGEPHSPCTDDVRSSFVGDIRSVCLSLEGSKKLVLKAPTILRTSPGRSTPQDLARSFARLPDESILIENTSWCVHWLKGIEDPLILQDIGRLREETFRAAGEGTGNQIDLDRFDTYYHHLVLYDRVQQRIVGAYRLGEAEREVSLNRLYTRTLFEYTQEFTNRIGPSLELGRSFIIPEFQRSYTPLLFLWRGIGRFLTRHPQFRRLFGPVSISARYSLASRALLQAWLLEHAGAASLTKLVRPLRRLEISADSLCPENVRHLPDLAALDAQIQALEGSRLGVPILVKEYLKLGARFLSFSVDGGFSDALDGLLVVDLEQVPLKTLERYLGREEAAAYLGVGVKRSS